MNKNEKAILIGMAIGDGYIKCKKDPRYNSFQSSINFIHCKAQEDYINYKADLIHSIFGGNRPSVVCFNNNGYLGCRMMKHHKYLRIIYRLLYPYGKKYISERCLKYLTPQALAIWYMDDGNLAKKRRDGKIHAYELYLNTFVSDEENNAIIDYFQNTWGIKFSKVKNHNGYRLRCGTIEARKFIKLIDPYIIPCMKYKVDISKKDI